MFVHSKRHVNGRPTCCAFEPCNEKLDQSHFRAADGRYYCSEECAVEAENFGLRRIDNLARQVA
jgi:Prokaryotic metallothionein